MRRFALFLLLALAFALLRLPASLMDRALDAASDGRLRIAHADGSVWRGRGVLASRDGRRPLQARRPIAWRIGVADGAPALELDEHGRVLARLRLTPSGGTLDRLDLDVPIAVVADVADHPVARAGWRGSLRVSSPALRCDWHRRCDGTLDVVWRDAQVAILPDRRLGDYRAALRLSDGEGTYDVETLGGAIHVAGRGTFDRAGRASFEGTVEGDPEIVDRIPNIMDRHARPTGVLGRIAVVLR